MLRLRIDPEKPYRAPFICQDGLCCCNMALISFRLFRKNLGNLRDFFGQMVYRPPWQKISRTPMFKTKNFLLMHHGKVVKEVFGTTTSSTKVVKISIFQTFSLFLPFNGRTGDREEMKFYTVEVNYSRW